MKHLAMMLVAPSPLFAVAGVVTAPTRHRAVYRNPACADDRVCAASTRPLPLYAPRRPTKRLLGAQDGLPIRPDMVFVQQSLERDSGTEVS